MEESVSKIVLSDRSRTKDETLRSTNVEEWLRRQPEHRKMGKPQRAHGERLHSETRRGENFQEQMDHSRASQSK